MTTTEMLIVTSTLIAPLLAVQAQKWLERFRENRERKLRVFKTLMATRAASVSPEHVQALNMIDLEFQGDKFKPVRTAWKTYLDHLSSYPKEDERIQALWGEKRVDLLARLLMEMGNSLGYEFDEVHVKKGIYAPEAHSQIENENTLLRQGLLRLIYGDWHLKMDVTSLPVAEQSEAEQQLLRQHLIELLKGNRSLNVSTSLQAESKPDA